MAAFAIDLEDRALSCARNGQLLSSAPSAVFDGSTWERAGTPAWRALRLHPTATSTRHLGALLTGAAAGRAAALLGAELNQRLAACAPAAEEGIWIAASARAEARGLGAILGVLQDLRLPVDGFVDAATAQVAALALEGPAIVLELGLHHVAATALERAGQQVSRRRTVVSPRGGWLEAHQSWLDLVSRAMVKQTRFDPLHDARTEQQLFDSLGSLTREAQAHGAATAVLGKGSEQFQVVISRDQLPLASQAVNREVMSLLHGLHPAGAPSTLLAPRALIELPGLREELDGLVGCELICVPDGFAAAAISLMELPRRAAGEPVRLLRRLPVGGALLAEQVVREPLGTRRSGGPPPTHVLLDGQAYMLAGDPLVVGRAPGSQAGDGGTRTLSLPEGLAGVSRRHCTFLSAGGETALLDHSSFGTFVNGERVAERVRLRAGDLVRLGEPGVELALIAVGEGATPS